MALRKGRKGVIRLHDTTDHGGRVIQVKHTHVRDEGLPIACVGDLVECPKCKGVYEIVEGSDTHRIMGDNVAYDGHHTACGAKLISTFR